jgi:membrane protein required for colicin V production
MSFFDTTLLVIMTVFVLNGLVKGLIRSVGSLVALLAGVWSAIYFYPVLYHWLSNLFFGFGGLGRAVCFGIIYLLVNRLVNLGFSVLNNAYDLISFIPFLKTINRLAGAVFGFVEGGLILGLLLVAGSRYPEVVSVISRWTKDSEVAPFLVSFAKLFLPILPEVIKKVGSWYGNFKFNDLYPDVLKNKNLNDLYPDALKNNSLLQKWKQ